MGRFGILIVLLLTVFGTTASAQVKIRLFSSQSVESAIFSVTGGIYELNFFNSEHIIVRTGESLFISRLNNKLAVKARNSEGFICDSIALSGQTGNDYFSLRLTGKSSARRNYSGDLQCFPDMGNIVLINTCDIEKYISGVMKAEGGSGKDIEYFKTQAVIARTYVYKYFDKHLTDRYNVCDNTHCQVFHGLFSDTIIDRVALETRGLVILDKDSILIISPFHSNCGGETLSSGDVWLTSQPYLKEVVDPYCLSSRNAEWEKRINMNDWLEFLKKLGYNAKMNDPTAFSFSQKSRLTDYRTGSFSIPFKTIRSEMNLRSSFFSVFSEGKSIILKGKGYGHGVGLCQEGAMAMAAKGFSYRQIIDFYYFGVIISDIKNVK